jgi:hypothetical protein
MAARYEERAALAGTDDREAERPRSGADLCPFRDSERGPCHGRPLVFPSGAERYCPCPDGQRALARVERALAGDPPFPEHGVPLRLAGCTPQSAYDLHVTGTADKPATEDSRRAFLAVQAFVRAFDNGGKTSAGLFISGPVGTGKSGLLAAAKRGLNRRGVPVLWTTYRGLFRSVQDEYGRGTEGNRKLLAQRAPVLVIDDLGDPYRTRGDVQETEDRRGILLDVLGERSGAMLPTLITGNQASLDEADEQFDPRVADRIHESCVRVWMGGATLRKEPELPADLDALAAALPPLQGAPRLPGERTDHGPKRAPRRRAE